MTPADIRWMLALTGPRLIARGARRRRELGLDDRMLRRSLSAIERALRGGRARTRREVGEALARSRIDPTGQRLPYLLMHAELEGLVCGGPRRGRDHTYVLLDDIVPVAPAVGRGAALAELARRYFAGHGPAGIADFSWWAGLTVADCRSAIEAAGSALASRSLEGATLWWTLPRPRGSTIRPRVRLLPHFDEYLIAYRERSMYGTALGSAPWPPAIVGGHTVVIEGILAGTWRQRRTDAGVAVEVTLARTVEPATRSEIRSAAEVLGEYIGAGLDSVTISR